MKGWFTGRLRGTIGLFPGAYVEAIAEADEHKLNQATANIPSVPGCVVKYV